MYRCTGEVDNYDKSTIYYLFFTYQSYSLQRILVYIQIKLYRNVKKKTINSINNHVNN
jgi:hypothetical protein